MFFFFKLEQDESAIEGAIVTTDAGDEVITDAGDTVITG